MSTEGTTVNVMENVGIRPAWSETVTIGANEKLCRTCRHFDQDGTPSPEWGHCQMAKGMDGAPVRFRTKAFASDAAKFGARLNVAPDHSCGMWEQK